MHNLHMDVELAPNLERAIRVVADVDCQWDLFLANTFTVQQLQCMNFSEISMPTEWFVDWLNLL